MKLSSFNMKISLVFALLIMSVDGGIIIGGRTSAFLSSETTFQNELKRAVLFGKLESIMGPEFRQAAEIRVPVVESVLGTTYNALPKLSNGRISSAWSSFALNRYFVKEHGWAVKGLVSDDNAWDTFPLLNIVRGVNEKQASELFGAQEQDVGFDLHELSVLAAMLENMMVEDVNSVFRQIWQNEHDDIHSTIQHDELWRLAMDFYMVTIYEGASSDNTISRHAIDSMRTQMKSHNNIDGMENFIASTLAVLFENEMPMNKEYTYDEGLQLALEIAHNRVIWQMDDCHKVKKQLINIDPAAALNGRIPLDKFYESALDGNRQFRERFDYLDAIGALDTTTIDSPQVIIPNYLAAPSNCMSNSDFYDVCCVDECEPLMQHLEASIGNPDAYVAQIISLVENLASSTAAAPGKLPDYLITRLNSIAAHHHGLVPLHSRLFAQWMHNVYPRECRYPHKVGSKKYMSPSEFVNVSGLELVSSRRDMLNFVLNSSRIDTGENEVLSELYWDHHEDFPAPRSHSPSPRPFFSTVILRISKLAIGVALLWFALNNFFNEGNGPSRLPLFMSKSYKARCL